MRIGILTGGGDVPGLNPCIKAVVERAAEKGHQVVGIRRGWGGLLLADPDDPATLAEYSIALDPMNTRTIDRSGGTILHSSRTHPGKVKASQVPDFLAGSVQGDEPYDFTSHAIRVLEATHVDTAESLPVTK